MSDALATIRDRLGKAQAKAARAEKAWEAAKAEAQDLQTALRVMSEIMGEPPTIQASSTQNRQILISRLLQVGEENGKSPADIFDEFSAAASENISTDTFRTTIWRMKDNAVSDGQNMWLIKGDNGRYWKLPATWNTTNRQTEAERIASKWGASDDDDTEF